jgi:N-acyl-D-amino-acid deacylase
MVMTDVMYDLKITGGLIVDGTGQPAFSGAVGVRDGRIVAVGEVTGSAREEIDATGKVVCPGFIDIHTHYDAQMLWDPMMTISPYFGVTTAFIGNCGFGVAPARPADHERMIRTLEKVEGMPFDSTFTGIEPHWTFETFPEYLDTLDRYEFGMNVCVLVPHTPVRVYVMGEDADRREANQEEISAMAEIVRTGVEAGAWGFSTSNHRGHIGLNGRLAPSVYASLDEYRALILAMSAAGRGTVQAVHGEVLDYATMAKLSQETGRNFTSALITDEQGPGSHHDAEALIEAMQKQGSRLWPQVSPRPFVLGFTFLQSNFFSHVGPEAIGAEVLDDLFNEIAQLPDRAAQLTLVRDPDFQARFVERTSSPKWSYLFDHTEISEYDPDPSLVTRRIGAIAQQRGVAASELLLDLAANSNLQAVFALVFMNGDDVEVSRVLKRPGVRLGVTDGGAHVSELNDAGYPAYVLGEWVRKRGLFSIEEAVEMLTSRSASLFGIVDRGTVRPGFAADLVIFDPATISATPLHRVNDLPQGAERLVSEPIGIQDVIVNGVPMIRDGEVIETKLPGALLRSKAPTSH